MSAIGATSFAGAVRPRRRVDEPRHIVVIKALLYALALVFYLHPYSSAAGLASALLMSTLGVVLARTAYRRGLRVLVATIVGPALLLLALLLGDRLLDSHLLVGWLGSRRAFVAADVLVFGLAALCTVFVLRTLAHRHRALSLLEVAFVAGSVASILAAHRNRMLNRPRYFSDWAWSMGVDPSTILIGIGAVATLLAVFLFLREQRLLKLLTTLVLLLILGIIFYLGTDKRIESKRAADALGLSGKSKSKAGGSKSPFKDDYDQADTPQPVAVAILRDDYQPPDGLLYFRQRTLSKYNGHHLVAAEDVDRDVITRLPSGAEPLTAKLVQAPEHHIKLPTTMYLLVDHPQPPALTHAQRVRLVQNPNPQRFVAAYEVISQVLSVPPKRLIGRRSIPAGWSKQRRRHYTEIPDDPRYRTLADIIVRQMDPRFAHDDLARAYAIKRYLERKGFYTRKSKHSSRKDPTASFLFGSLRGYCVHFAHAAAYLFRSQGIATRVALGYAVQTHKRSGGSSILIMGDRAHAWPEIHLEGVGWVTFDIYPERTDMPPAPPVDYDLEKLLGELARNDPTGGLSADGKPVMIPWTALAQGAGLLVFSILALAYLIKIYRRLAPRLRGGASRPCLAYVAVLDCLSDLGAARKAGETRERHAARLATLSPALQALTRAHLARALGSARPPSAEEIDALAAAVRVDLRQNVHPLRRALAFFNPLGWLVTR